MRNQTHPLSNRDEAITNIAPQILQQRMIEPDELHSSTMHESSFT